MHNNGSDNSMNNIAQRMKQAAEQQRQGLEKMIAQQFSDLNASLSRLSKDALTTTEGAIQERLTSLEQSIALPCRALSWTFAKRWLQMLLISGAIFLGITLAGWGLFAMAQNKIVSLSKEISDLQAAMTAAEQGYQEVMAKFKGISLMHHSGKDYLILPNGYKAETGWKVGNSPAILISTDK